MSAKNPIFKILRCPDCGKQNWHTELQSPIPACSKCGGSATYSADWYIKVIVEGKRHIQSIGRTKQHAESALKKAEAEIFYDTYQIKQDFPLLSTAIDTLYESRWKKGKVGDQIRRRAELAMEIIGDIPINTISKKHIMKISSALTARGTSDSTCNRYQGVLRTILIYHKVKHDCIEMSPEREGRLYILSPEEEVKVFDFLNNKQPITPLSKAPEMPDLCRCLLDTGARLNEMLKLPAKDINFTTNLLTIWRNKTEKPRSIPMTAKVVEILKRRSKNNPDRLFNLNGIQAEYEWAWMREKLGMEGNRDFVLHALRHTCATRLLLAGVDIYRVKMWMGHKSLKTTERYVHLVPRDLKNALELLERYNAST